MPKNIWTKLTAALAERILALTDSNRKLQQRLARQEALNRSLDIKGKKAKTLLEESRQLQQQLQEMTHQVFLVKEDGSKKISLRLQDEIVQRLEGIHLRLLVLSNEVTANGVDFEKDIAITQDLVRQSIQVISTFARECDIPYEN
jgi:hypothetical protein